ncbi:hypothetical protein RHYG_00012 [Rhizobium phage RR1-B]|uniref:hypothetical protein n=1 Tax=Rhizobium phage RR1-B TaxID=929834 RepID=UPI0003429620|nr:MULTISPECIES: hypothetical protein [Rhizobium/Agrobacterium group]YP_008129826.1 hypothetical protein RHYG_00012 [Rhizobium phage RR1-B]AGN38681.1 hypothetical protein RHYG_00012 [Rhizobium phage RR1-B]CAD7023052.1 hypothetical protein RP007_00073 [Rhizobium sp. P007]HAU74370.1 hypothetical protein [Agrobacterium sp.]
MLKLSALLSFIKVHMQSYENGGASLPPEAAGAVAILLSSCEAHAKDMEAVLQSTTAAPVDLRPLLSGNVVSLSAFASARKAKPSSNPTETA